jgi:peptidoglycan/xylan/chitin deacetylase (PgdA/CDA1 family)
MNSEEHYPERVTGPGVCSVLAECTTCPGNGEGRGVPRLLETFEKFGIKTTWFLCGHSIDTFYANIKRVADAGHEIEPHGYTHENPTTLTREQKRRYW